MRVLVIIAGLLALAGCSYVPFNIFGGSEPAPPARPTPESRRIESVDPPSAADDVGPLQEAEAQVQAARAKAAPAGGDELELATRLTHLASVQRARGHAAEAIPLYEEALAIRERTLNPEHPEVATTLNSLAAAHLAADNYDAAEPLLARALALRERALGPTDRLTARSLNNLALLYAAQARYDTAEPLYQRAIVVFEGKYPDDLVIVLDNYAALLDDSGRAEEARTMEARANTLRHAGGTGLVDGVAPKP
ncbi:MAG: tetratricopeptide repeat protein [Candidatus Binatia bacterium]